MYNGCCVSLIPQSSGEGKSLSLPVSYRILETVIHYMYTDEAPSVTGVCGGPYVWGTIEGGI